MYKARKFYNKRIKEESTIGSVQLMEEYAKHIIETNFCGWNLSNLSKDEQEKEFNDLLDKLAKEERNMYEIRKITDEQINRYNCETVIEYNKRLIEKPKKEQDWWVSERLCKYNGRFIWFRNDNDKVSYFQTINLIPYEVSEEFFNKKVVEWKREGCGYYIII